MVYQGEDPHLRRRIALKVMTPSLAESDGPRQRFLREARAMAALTHDHIVPIYHVGEERGVLYLAMPFLEGETLESRLKRVGPPPARTALPLAEVLRIGREIADGLEAAHAHGLIHRDVKPSNVWLEAGSDRVKILDFGLSRALQSDDRLTRTGYVLGTPEFMSPEQANGRPSDARADLFSLGCVLYLLCTGTSPFKRDGEFDTMLAVARDEPPSPRNLNPALPAATADLILHLLAKDPDRRPRSARAAADALEALGRPSAGPARPPRPWRRRTAWVAAAVAGVAVAAALAVAFARASRALAIKEIRILKKWSKKTPARRGRTPRRRTCRPGRWARRTARPWPPCRRESNWRRSRPSSRNSTPASTAPSAPVRRHGRRLAHRADDRRGDGPFPGSGLAGAEILARHGQRPGKGKLADLSSLRGTKLTAPGRHEQSGSRPGAAPGAAAGVRLVRPPAGSGPDAAARDQDAAADQHAGGGRLLERSARAEDQTLTPDRRPAVGRGVFPLKPLLNGGAKMVPI